MFSEPRRERLFPSVGDMGIDEGGAARANGVYSASYRDLSSPESGSNGSSLFLVLLELLSYCSE